MGVGPVEGAAGSRGWCVAPPSAPVEVSWLWEDPCVVGRVRVGASSGRGLVGRVRVGRQSGRARVPLVGCPAGRPRFDGAGLAAPVRCPCGGGAGLVHGVGPRSGPAVGSDLSDGQPVR